MKDSTYEKYCLVIDEWFINGFNGTKAYQKFYPKSTENTADKAWRQIHGNPRIKEYQESKSKNTSNKLQITLESQLLELEELKGLCMVKDKFGDAINAVKEQNKLLALYKAHNEQKQPKQKDYSNLTDEDMIELAKLEKKASS